MFLVSKAQQFFFITVASSWFSKVINKDASCFVNRGFVWLFADQNLKRSSIFEQQNERFKTFQCQTVSSPVICFQILPLISHTDSMFSISRCGIKCRNNSINFEKNPNYIYRSLVASSSNTVRSSGEINIFD